MAVAHVRLPNAIRQFGQMHVPPPRQHLIQFGFHDRLNEASNACAPLPPADRIFLKKKRCIGRVAEPFCAIRFMA
jgi:hypothetical protein